MCGEFKYETQFHAKHDKSRSPHALRRVQTHCKDCFRAYRRELRRQQRLDAIFEARGSHAGR